MILNRHIFHPALAAFNHLLCHNKSILAVENALIDYLEVSVQGGKGGMGCTSLQNLQRNKIKLNGGDGGDGGSVIFQCSALKNDFSHIPSEIKGNSGTHGSGFFKKGAKGKDRIILVPIGSTIGCIQSQRVVAELKFENESYKGASGGAGGKGNYSISKEISSINKNAIYKDKEDGREGDIAELYLEMKVIADVGLVGLPNAGKSSILNAMSSAKPKVASYPFTTLRPHVGVIHYDGYYRLTMADIPGLIEGSSQGFGLGISFLKHIERCLTLLYVVDVSDMDNEPIKTIKTLEKELEAYKKGMTDKVTGIILNKIDLLQGPDMIIEFSKHFTNYSVIPISALEQRNIISVRNLIEPFKKLHRVD